MIDEQTVMIRQQVVALRAEGRSFASIGRVVGISRQRAWAICQQFLEQEAKPVKRKRRVSKWGRTGGMATRLRHGRNYYSVLGRMGMRNRWHKGLKEGDVKIENGKGYRYSKQDGWVEARVITEDPTA